MTKKCNVLESVNQVKIYNMLVRNGAEMYIIMATNKPGCPDIMGCLEGGLFFAVEAKRVGEKARVLQKYRIRQIHKRGGLAVVADTEEKVKNYLAQHKIFLDK